MSLNLYYLPPKLCTSITYVIHLVQTGIPNEGNFRYPMLALLRYGTIKIQLYRANLWTYLLTVRRRITSMLPYASPYVKDSLMDHGRFPQLNTQRGLNVYFHGI